jgi:hypothetical protein
MTLTQRSPRLMHMATPSHITMLREISATGDRERTGALDVEWEGARVTLFFMFGHPSHVVFENADGRNLVGEPALDAFVAELPTEFRVAPWRRAMVTDDTLHCTAEDLMGLFQRRNAAVDSNGHVEEPPAPAAAPSTEAFAADATSPAVPPAPPATTEQPPFGLRDLPLLPLATTLWTDAAANVINLEAALPRLPDSIIVLAGPTCQGAALIARGRVTDAWWVNTAGGSLGDEAAHAVMNSLEGTLTAYRVDDPRILTALPMLWRGPRLGAGLPGGWLHTEDVVAEVRTSGRSCCLVVDSADPGVVLFASGELVAVYTLGHRWPATSMAALRGLLHEPGALVTVLGDDGADAAPADAAVESPADTTEVPVAESSDAVADTDVTAEVVADIQTTPEAADAEVTARAVADTETPPETVADAEGTPEAAADADVSPQAVVETDAVPEAVADAAADESTVTDASAREARPKGRGRKGNGKPHNETIDAPTDTAEAEVAAGDELAPVELHTDGADASPEPVVLSVDATAASGADDEAALGDTAQNQDAATAGDTGAEPATLPVDDLQFESAPRAVGDARFEPAVFTIADLAPQRTSPEPANDPSGMAGVEAREATEFVPARLDIDVDALRTELTDIATVWLGEEDAAPVAQAIGAARPGVDDFVSTIRAIGTMEIPGHESAVVRAMAREMHFRASEVLCGV